jgi:hypothetical protein
MTRIGDNPELIRRRAAGWSAGRLVRQRRRRPAGGVFGQLPAGGSRIQHFSWWMTTLLHTFDSYDAYDRRLQQFHLDYVSSSDAAITSLAENYVGRTSS